MKRVLCLAGAFIALLLLPRLGLSAPEAMPPEVSLSSDCNATNRVPFTGSINNPQDRVRYYGVLMNAFRAQPVGAQSGLINTLSKGPGF